MCEVASGSAVHRAEYAGRVLRVDVLKERKATVVLCGRVKRGA